MVLDMRAANRRVLEQFAKDGIGTPMQTVIDVWGGEGDQDHVARFLRHWDKDTQALISRELANGFLVNVRREVAWGDDEEFDARPAGAKGLN